jgi:hypothetical protein
VIGDERGVVNHAAGEIFFVSPKRLKVNVLQLYSIDYKKLSHKALISRAEIQGEFL